MPHFGFPAETIVIFFAVIGVSVFLDLFAHRQAKEISVLDASLWSAFWIGLALAFYGYLWVRFDKQWADLYLAGFALEKSLSVDNLIVFMAIFASFGIRGVLQHRILYWGIVGALVFRGIFVAVGTSLFALTPWVGFAFAAILLWSAWKMLAYRDGGELADYSQHWSVKLTRRVMPVFPRLCGARFFVARTVVDDLARSDPTITLPRDATMFATPAFLCLIAIEASDIIFAFDSVPAVIAVTQEPLLVYAAMIFAILGLRSLYFVLVAVTRYLVHLEKAVIALLVFIAVKMAAQASEHLFGVQIFHLSPKTSLLIVLGTLGVGVIASLIWPGSALVRQAPALEAECPAGPDGNRAKKPSPASRSR